jgi:hypothetical protein
MDPTNWLPFYPDLLPRRRALRGSALASQPPYSAAIFPVVDVLAGLTFLPAYPDRVPHVRETREQTTVTTSAIFTTILAPAGWFPAYPDQVPHRRLAIGNLPSAAPPFGYFVVVAQSLAWQARYPDCVAYHRPPLPAGAFWTIGPEIAAAGEPCVALGLDTFGAPALLAQVVSLPALIEEGLGTPALIDEDLCP